MQVTNSFTLPVSIDRLWEVLTDVELVAPAIAGFQLTEVAEPDYRGTMTIKIGAITVRYDVTIRFIQRDQAARRAVLAIVGRELRGSGTASAKMTATLVGDEQQTTAEMLTDIEVTGRAAQFGRGIISDVASTLTKQFIDELGRRILSQDAAGRATADEGMLTNAHPVETPSVPIEPRSRQDNEPLDLGAAALSPVLERLAPVAVIGVLLVAIVKRKRR